MHVFSPIEYALAGCLCPSTVNCCYGPEDDMGDALVMPHDHDILFGRGGKNNKHVGNERLRQMARANIQTYKAASKKGKSHISRTIVGEIRSLRPSGRFLKRDYNTGLWVEVGDEVAREKTSQALRDAVSQWNSSRSGDNKKTFSIYENENQKDDSEKDENDESANYPADDFLPPLPSSPNNFMSSPPPPPKHHPHPPIVSPSRSSPSLHSALKHHSHSRISPVPVLSSTRISPAPVLSAEFLCEISSDMTDFDLFNGSLLQKTGSASSGSLSFTQPREKKMRMNFENRCS